MPPTIVSRAPVEEADGLKVVVQDGLVRFNVLVTYGAIDRIRQSPMHYLTSFRENRHFFERLIREKCRQGKFEVDGTMRITGADVLRAQAEW